MGEGADSKIEYQLVLVIEYSDEGTIERLNGCNCFEEEGGRGGGGGGGGGRGGCEGCCVSEK